MDDPRYPIGRLENIAEPTAQDRQRFIQALASAPAQLRVAVTGLHQYELDMPYREGGWMIKQLVHHVADSHLNAYLRCKLMLTEQQPTIKPYNQDTWAFTADALSQDIQSSLQIVEGVHHRWVTLLLSLEAGDFRRTLNHPERGVMTLDDVLQLYAWHGRHHVAQIIACRKRIGHDLPPL